MSSVAPLRAVEGIETFLSRVEFFAPFNQSQRARIAAIAQLVQLPAGKQVYHFGDPAYTFYVLVEGTILFTLSVGLRQATAGQIIGHGEVFGWAAIVEPGQPRNGSAIATAQCTAVAIDGSALIALADADHELGYILMRSLNKIITGTLMAFAAG